MAPAFALNSDVHSIFLALLHRKFSLGASQFEMFSF